MKHPLFLTFTGADDATSVDEMVALSQLYPIEWGILFSPSQQGEGRYPSIRFIKELAERAPSLRLSAHLCGGHSRAVLSNQATGLEALLTQFQRVQVNTLAEPSCAPDVAAWVRSVHPGLRAILQCRGDFPEEDIANLDWPYDLSGGRGLSPVAWPRARSTGMSGYAGGLRPGNIAEAMLAIGAHAQDFWLDMEAGIRDERDRFSVDLCRQVCEQVWAQHVELDRSAGLQEAHSGC
jgi:hypothetical protein